MTDGTPKPEKELLLPHVRASNFKQLVADGYLVRVEGSNVIITFYINDSVVTGERMQLAAQTQDAVTYRGAGIEERNQRVQVVAVRMPINEFLGGADVLKRKVDELMKLRGPPPGTSEQ
jgi:hypothetical protein